MYYETVEQSRIDFLRGKPWWTDYHTRLQDYIEDLGFPGSHIVSFPDKESIIEELFDQSVVTAKDVIFINGNEGDCHNNCDDLFAEKKIDAIIYGYALSDDGLWRNHSWGLKGEKIVETTGERLAYLGIQRK
jgi:hypothetical protein